MRPNQWASTRGYRFHINNAGLRGRDFVVPKPADVYRIAFLGDSITYGGGAVSDEDLFSSRVARLVAGSTASQVEAINVAVPNWGIQNVESYLKARGLFDADLVVWVIPSCDFRRPRTSIDDGSFPRHRYRFRLRYVVEVGGFRLRALVARRRHGPAPSSQTLTQNLEALQSGLREITRKGTPVVVVFVPSERGYYRVEDFNAFRAMVESCSVAFLDLGPELIGHSEDFVSHDIDHLDTQGHQDVSSYITAFLKMTYPVRAAEQTAGAARTE